MMAERLHILMPCAKPHNIPAIAPSLLQCEGHAFELRWHILQQGPEPDPKGMLKINEALNWIKDGWFWTPNDDSIQYHSVIRRAGEVIAANPGCGAVVFSEDRGPEKNQILRAHANNMKPCQVDGSQIFFNREMVGEHRFEWDKHHEQADGNFIMELFAAFPDRFVFVDEVLVRFNSLEWTP